MPEIKEVFFDWDGTIADTEAISLSVTRRVLSDYANSVFGRPMAGELNQLDMRGKDFGQIGRQFQDIINKGLPPAEQITIDVEHLRIEKLRPLTREALLEARLAPNIAPALAELQEDLSLGVAIVSNSPRLRIQPLLDKHALDARIPKGRLFSAFEDVAKLKEDPAIYLLAAERLEVQPQHAAAVEDSVTGMRAAKNAGIGLRVGYTGLTEPEAVAEMTEKLKAEGAHVVISDMRQLPAVIRAHQLKP